MSADDNDVQMSPLARVFARLDRLGHARSLVYALLAACVVSVALGFTYTKHSYIKDANFNGFYALYGFVMFAGLIFAAKGLRVLVKRREDYYAPYVIDTEEYPDDQLERIDADA
jgi:hypothetical protein